jgi:hypothetical protein
MAIKINARGRAAAPAPLAARGGATPRKRRRATLSAKDVERFWAKVDQSGDCWLWKCKRTASGGQFRVNGKRPVAHRIAWEVTRGAIPPRYAVRRTCGNLLCVRPEHLQLASGAECAWRAKLTPSQVAAIRQRYSTGTISQRGLAREFGVSPQSINRLLHNLTWRQVTPPRGRARAAATV